jgi:Na+/H+-translocating membrane pyrophosphatase
VLLSQVFRLLLFLSNFGTIVALGFLLILFHSFYIAISSSNTGGAWDNAKKYIEVILSLEFTDNLFSYQFLHINIKVFHLLKTF